MFTVVQPGFQRRIFKDLNLVATILENIFGFFGHQQCIPVDRTNKNTNLRHASDSLFNSICLIYPSYFKLHVRWLRSLTRITYLSKLIGIPSLAAFLKLELFRVYKSNTAVIVIRQILLDKMLAILT
ncbi:IAP repeat-containing protein 6 [Pectobacterium polonicum]|nr:IAP repeat-containing protein 6 [Pectobacterium polonicum]